MFKYNIFAVSARANKLGISCLQGIENKKLALINYCQKNDFDGNSTIRRVSMWSLGSLPLILNRTTFGIEIIQIIQNRIRKSVRNTTFWLPPLPEKITSDLEKSQIAFWKELFSFQRDQKWKLIIVFEKELQKTNLFKGAGSWWRKEK